MARIAGVNIPQNKLVQVGLTYIYGIGDKFSNEICKALEIPKSKRVNELTDDQILKIREYIDQKFTVEGDLRRETSLSIKRLIDLATYRGSRHRKKLPVRGQRTRCNSRTSWAAGSTFRRLQAINFLSKVKTSFLQPTIAAAPHGMLNRPGARSALIRSCRGLASRSGMKRFTNPNARDDPHHPTRPRQHIRFDSEGGGAFRPPPPRPRDLCRPTSSPPRGG